MGQLPKIIVLIGGLIVVSGAVIISSAIPANVAGAAPAQRALLEKTGTPATVVDDRDAGSVLGKNVRSRAGEDLGRIVDIIVSRSGQVRAAVIDFGGFLGVGSRKVVVAWNALRFSAVEDADPVTVELTRDQVRLAPEFLPGEPIVVLGSPAPQPEPRYPQREIIRN
jgi:hypothetical protein